MRRIQSSKHGLLLTPLIDIMFLLTLFFVINTSFQKERYIEIELPEASSAQSRQAEAIVITLLPENIIMFNGDEIIMDDLTDKVMRQIQDTGKNDVIIQGDKSVSYQFVISVMDRVRLAGSNTISLQTIINKS